MSLRLCAAALSVLTLFLAPAAAAADPLIYTFDVALPSGTFRGGIEHGTHAQYRFLIDWDNPTFSSFSQTRYAVDLLWIDYGSGQGRQTFEPVTQWALDYAERTPQGFCPSVNGCGQLLAAIAPWGSIHFLSGEFLRDWHTVDPSRILVADMLVDPDVGIHNGRVTRVTVSPASVPEASTALLLGAGAALAALRRRRRG